MFFVSLSAFLFFFFFSFSFDLVLGSERAETFGLFSFLFKT